MILRQNLTQKMTEEEKLIIIVKICSYEKLTKKLFKTTYKIDWLLSVIF